MTTMHRPCHVSDASATEATSIVHTVTLSNASSVATTYSLSLVDGSATGVVALTTPAR